MIVEDGKSPGNASSGRKRKERRAPEHPDKAAGFSSSDLLSSCADYVSPRHPNHPISASACIKTHCKLYSIGTVWMTEGAHRTPIHHGRRRSCPQCEAAGGGRVMSPKEGDKVWPSPSSRRDDREVHRWPKTRENNIGIRCHSLQQGVWLRAGCDSSSL